MSLVIIFIHTFKNFHSIFEEFKKIYIFPIVYNLVKFPIEIAKIILCSQLLVNKLNVSERREVNRLTFIFKFF